MRIALVWNPDRRDADRPVTALSFRFELYVEGLRWLGHDPVVVCPNGCRATAPYPLVCGTADELESAGFWRQLGAEVAIVITHHRRVATLEALHAADVWTVALADSDGRVGFHTHPWAHIQRTVVYLEGWKAQLGAAKYFLGRWLRGSARDDETREMIASTRASDAVVFHGEQAIGHFRAMLRRRGVDDELGGRLHAVPFAVSPRLCDVPLVTERADRVIAVGRWSDPQKDTPLLRRALARTLPRRPSTVFRIYGREADAAFGPLAKCHPNLELMGFCPPEDLHRDMAHSRAVLFSSRWETGPHSATEALALGTTLVGAPIPNLIDLSEDGRVGTVARDRRPSSLAAALEHELALWDAGERNPIAVAERWRPRLRPEAICRQLLGTLGQRGSKSP